MRPLATLIVIVAIVAAIYYFYTKKKEDEAVSGDGIFDRGTQKAAAAKPINSSNDVANLAIMLHNTMSRSFFNQRGGATTVLGAIALGPLTGSALLPGLSYEANQSDFTNADSWKALLAQSDRNIIAVNNYFNARYKAEGKGNLYNWINNEREIPLTTAYTTRTKLQDKMRKLGLS